MADGKWVVVVWWGNGDELWLKWWCAVMRGGAVLPGGWCELVSNLVYWSRGVVGLLLVVVYWRCGGLS